MSMEPEGRNANTGMAKLVLACLLGILLVASGCDESSVTGGPDREKLKQAGDRCLKESQAKDLSAKRLQNVMRKCLQRFDATGEIPKQ